MTIVAYLVERDVVEEQRKVVDCDGSGSARAAVSRSTSGRAASPVAGGRRRTAEAGDLRDPHELSAVSIGATGGVRRARTLRMMSFQSALTVVMLNLAGGGASSSAPTDRQQQLDPRSSDPQDVLWDHEEAEQVRHGEQKYGDRQLGKEEEDGHRRLDEHLRAERPGGGRGRESPSAGDARVACLRAAQPGTHVFVGGDHLQERTRRARRQLAVRDDGRAARRPAAGRTGGLEHAPWPPGLH